VFAQMLITLAIVALAAVVLWRWVARPLIDALVPDTRVPKPPEAAEREKELRTKRRERERLTRQVELASEIRRLEPELEQLKEKLRALEEQPERPERPDGSDVAHPRGEEE